MTSKFDTFAALHVPGDPVVLYNVWDVGSARAVIAAGAAALATGSHPVGDAAGFGDGEQVPLDFVFANARRIVAATELPVSIDFEGAYSADPLKGGENVVRLKETGAVGIVDGAVTPARVGMKRGNGGRFLINSASRLIVMKQKMPSIT